MRVSFGMESGVESDGNKRRWPDAVGGINEEATADPGHTIANEVGCESNEQLVGKVRSIWLVKVLGEILDPYN